jgi:hypothetical protein
VLGASATHLVAYASEPVPPASPAASLLGPASAGYSLYRFEGPQSCRFVFASTCPGNGLLIPVSTAEAAVLLTVYDDPAEVLIPSPAVSLLGGSGTSGGGCNSSSNIYGESITPCG